MKTQNLKKALGAFFSLFFVNCGSPSSNSGSEVTQSQYLTDLTTISNRQAQHGFPRLANNTQVSYGGNASNGYLGQNLFLRLHWYDYLVIDGNVSVATSYGTLTPFLGLKGSIRALNPNSVQTAYFSLADFIQSAPNICYQPLLTYYAFGPNFNVASCTDPGTDDFSNAWMYHDTSGNTLALYNFGTYYDHVPDPSNVNMQQRYMSSVQNMIIANKNTDGLYMDWAGFATIPYLGQYSTVSLLNNGVDNLGGLGNLNNINNAVNLDWQTGLLSIFSQERASYPSNYILTGNSGWGGTTILQSYTTKIQGTMVEDFLSSVASSTGWQGAMYTYGTWATNGQSPNFALIQADLAFGGATNDANHNMYDLMVATGNNWLTQGQLAQLRFGLASSLMFNGYFASSNTNASAGGYASAFWLDEFAVNASGVAVVPSDATASAARAAKGWLGQPLGLAYNATAYPANISTTLWSVVQSGPTNNSNINIWRRDFTNGIVLVNPTLAAVNNLNLGGTFKKIAGVVDPVFNTGASNLTTISLPAQTGVILHR